MHQEDALRPWSEKIGRGSTTAHQAREGRCDCGTEARRLTISEKNFEPLLIPSVLGLYWNRCPRLRRRKTSDLSPVERLRR